MVKKTGAGTTHENIAENRAENKRYYEILAWHRIYTVIYTYILNFIINIEQYKYNTGYKK